MQLNIVCKNKTPSGREELCAESLTVTVKEKAKEPPTTKPGVHRAAILHDEILPCCLSQCKQFCQLCVTGEKLLTLKQRLQLAMARRRQEERTRKAELNRLDNEDCGEEEEEEEEDMTDESGEEEVGASIGVHHVQHVCSVCVALRSRRF